MTITAVIGKNGAGKGTLLNNFLKGRDKSQYRLLSMSTLLKNVKETNPSLGEEIAVIMKSGGLVPDHIVLKVLKEELDRLAKEGHEVNAIIDGFPRTAEQAEALAPNGIVLGQIVEVVIDDEKVIKRSTERRVCPICKTSYTVPGGYLPPKLDGICNDCGVALVMREDDKESKVRQRLAQYYEHASRIKEILEHQGVPYHIVDNNDDDDSADKHFERLMTSV